MKKITYILFAISTALFINACSDDLLDLAPQNELTEAVFWTQEVDADLALEGCYKNWEHVQNLLLFDVATDNGYSRDGYGFTSIGNGQITAENYVQQSWPFDESTNWWNYNHVRKHNYFLENIDKIPVMDEQKRERYKAEVRFLRAYHYFNKVNLFGDVPLVKNTIPPDAKLSRDPAEKVQQFVIDELTEISKILPEQNMVESQGHITKGAALALLARFQLYLGNYDEALKNADAVINMSCFELYPDYRNLFLPKFEKENKEAILWIEYMAGKYANWMPQLNLPGGDKGWFEANATRNLVETYECTDGLSITESPLYNPDKPLENRDPRLEMTLIYSGHKWQSRYYNSIDKLYKGYASTPNPDHYELGTGILVRKYIQVIPDVTNYDGNWMVIRLAEMYLTYAEAAFKTGQNLGRALELINDLRQRSGQIAATELTEKLIRNERRVELAFEGLRYFDVKRWDIGQEVMPGPVYGTRLGKMTNWDTGEIEWIDEYVIVENRIFHPERKYLLPVPIAEIDANPNILPQNPGY